MSVKNLTKVNKYEEEEKSAGRQRIGLLNITFLVPNQWQSTSLNTFLFPCHGSFVGCTTALVPIRPSQDWTVPVKATREYLHSDILVISKQL